MPILIAPLLPAAAGRPTFQLLPRPAGAGILETYESTAAAPGESAPPAGYSLERYQRVRAAVERGEHPGEEQAAVGPGWTAPVPEVAVSTEAPKPPPPEVELPTYGTSLSVTGRKVIGFDFNEKRYTRDQTTTGRPKTTNLVEINQQLQLRMQGKVGPKITVNVDYDDTKTNQQDISVVYAGDPDEVVQNVSFGDIDLSLPATEFVSYNKQLFGIRADVKYKGFKATVIASRTKGTTKSKQFFGNSQFVQTDIPDSAYLRRQYYDITFGSATVLPIKAGSVRVVLAQQDATQANNVNLQTLTVDDLSCNNGCVNQSSSTFTGKFLTLVAGQDFTVNYAKGYIQFRNALQPQYVAAVDFVDANGVEAATRVSSMTEATGGTGLFKMIKTPYDVPIYSSATESGWDRELKTFYSIGQTSIIQDNGRGNFILQVLDPTSRKEVGSGLDPVQTYPTSINVDFANGIFQLQQPFSVGNDSPTVPDPDLYGQTPIQKRVFHVEYNYRFKTFFLEPNLVAQSELVVLDGVKLSRNVDYFIDYDAGFITFFNPDRILPTSEIDITYEVAPFAGATNDTLLGGRVSYDFNKTYGLGSTVLYDAGTKSPVVPDVSELAKSLLTYEFDAHGNTIHIGRKLTMTLKGEFAQSRQDLNLNNFALIDNMEGVSQETDVSTLASDWDIASNPSAIPSDPNRLSWASEDVPVLQIYPNAQANSNDTQKVLDLSYDFSSTNEESIVYPVSLSGVDLSQDSVLQIVLAGDGGANDGNEVDVHLGGINEDADGSGQLKTEDANANGLLDPGEDIGWCYAYGGNPCAARFGAGNGRIDTNDLNRNGHLDPADFTGGDFGYISDPNNTNNGDFSDLTVPSNASPLTGGVIHLTDSQWHVLQIPLNISSQTASNWTSIKQIRLSIKKGAGGLTTGKLRIAKIAVIGNTWQRGQPGDPATGAPALAQEALTVLPINNSSNPNYIPIYNAGGDATSVFNDLYGSLSNLQKQNNTQNISEQSLELAYSGLTPGATVYTRRLFPTAIDVSQHRQLNFLLYGNAPNQSCGGSSDCTGDQTFFLRAGTDQNYWEVQVPLTFAGWKKITVNQTDPGNGVMNGWTSGTPGTVVVSSGAPSLQQVGELVAGLYASTSPAHPSLAESSGTVYLDEIYLSQPVQRVGQAHDLQADFQYLGWGTFGFKDRSLDRNFQTPTSVVSNQDNRSDSAYLNLTRVSWMPVTMNVTRLVTDTPSTINTGDLSNLVNLLQQGKVTTWTGAAQANIAYGQWPRLNLAYNRNLIDYDLLTREDDKQTYTGTLQYGVPSRSRFLPRTIDANASRTYYDVRFKSDFARQEVGDYDSSERDETYGGRLTFTPWAGSSFNPNYTVTRGVERRTDYTSGAPVDSAYPKLFHQTMGFASNFRLRPWLNPQITYQMDDLENNVMSSSTFVVNSSTYAFRPGDIKTVTRSANGSVSVPIAIAEIFPRTRLFHSLNIISGYQLQDGDVWNNVEKSLNTSDMFFVRQTLRPSNPAAQLANLTLRDTYNSTQRWSPLEGYDIGGRLAAWRTLSLSNNYVLSVQRSETTGTASKTISRTLPDAVASISQLERLLHAERWMNNAQMDFKYSIRTNETVGATRDVQNSFGTDLRSLILRKYDTSLSYNLRDETNKDLVVDANTQKTHHEDATAQVTFDLRKFRFTPKVDYTWDVTTLGTGIQSQNVQVITPSVLIRADLSLPAGLRLPGSTRPLLFTNRIIWTTTLSFANRHSPVSAIDNSRLASLNTSADYELAKNLRMTLNGSAQRLWSLYLPEESYLAYTLGTTLTFQF
ncbi:MAG: hypothetical protein KGM24_09815 [Elusimicrobia bacterium]|nr:hypothetical protein [Elusimicrobiota bacterium]